MKDTTLDDIIEAALLAAGEPLPVERLETLFLADECPSRKALREALSRLALRHDNGALELVETASGFQLRIRPRLAHWVSRLWDERPQRYSRALLETLALIAYRQPVTRGDIEDVRGVSVSSSIIRTLMERGWIRVVGHRDVPGRPAVYATTRSFLDDFGLKTWMRCRPCIPWSTVTIAKRFLWRRHHPNKTRRQHWTKRLKACRMRHPSKMRIRRQRVPTTTPRRR